MTRTLTDLRSLQTSFLQTDLDNFAGASPSSNDQNSQINWALELIGRKCNLCGFANLPLVAGTQSYDLRALSPRVIRPFYVIVNQRPLYDASGFGYGLWSMGELIFFRPDWLADAAGQPTKAVFHNFNQLLLHPAPDAGTAALATGFNQVYGQYLPATLSGDSDVPDLPSEIHEAVAYLAAVNAALPMATEQEAWTRLQQFNNYWTQVVEDLAQQNERTMQAWNTTSQWYQNDLMAM